ncbi:hypothetical protein AWENTII_007751 [Aspergillus wentii]
MPVTVLNIFQRLQARNPFRSRPRFEVTRNHFEVLNMFYQIGEDRNALEDSLSHALGTVHFQDALLAEYDRLLEQAQPRAPDSVESPGESAIVLSQPPNVCASFGMGWIDSTWLRSGHNLELLGSPESEWENGHPHLALTIASSIHCNQQLSSLNRLKCCSFIAAVFHYLGKYDESNQILDDVFLRMDRDSNIHAEKVRGIAHFLRGKNLLAQGFGNEAYWAFSGALHTPGYYMEAQRLQREAIYSCARANLTNRMRALESELPEPGNSDDN